MKVIPYGHQSINKSDILEVIKVLKSDWITQGPYVETFEKSLAQYCEAKYAVVVSSGTAALHLACLAARLKEGDEAITTPITFIATANAIVYTGAKPVFADINSSTINIDPQEIEKKITRRTKAILPVHFGGLPCDMTRIHYIARQNKLTVIEDASHALGAEYQSKGQWIKVGSCQHSDMTVFSFHPVKHITTGEGGAITTNNKKLYKYLTSLRNHGIYRDEKTKRRGPWVYEMHHLGYNYRLTDFQCVLGLSQLTRLYHFVSKRQTIAQRYNLVFSQSPYLITPHQGTLQRSSWHLYVLRLRLDNMNKTRDDVFRQLQARKIGVQVHYIPVHLQPYYRKKMGYKSGDFPKAESYYKGAISIPLFPAMTNDNRRYVIKNILKIVN